MININKGGYYSRSMKLSSDKEYLVLENQKLVYYLVQRILRVTQNYSEYEDLVSIGTLGLVKAAITFDPSKKFTFATYASKCIKNEIFMYYRSISKYAKDISIEEPIADDGNEITVGDNIESSESNFVKNIVDEESCIQAMSVILNYLKGRERVIILYQIGGVYQKNIAKMYKVTRSYISRIQSKAIQKIKKVIRNPIYYKYKEVFFMSIIGDSYRISFSSKDISNFNKIFATLLQKFTDASTLPDFKVSCNKERIIIQVPAHPDSFAFIAQIIQEIDEFSMTFVSDKSMLAVDNNDSQKVRAEDTDKSNNSVEEMISSVVSENETVEGCSTSGEATQFENNATESNIGEKIKHTSQSKQIREFILALDKFSVKQIESKFPNVPVAIVNNVIRLAKAKGLITYIAEGEYVVNKI